MATSLHKQQLNAERRSRFEVDKNGAVRRKDEQPKLAMPTVLDGTLMMSPYPHPMSICMTISGSKVIDAKGKVIGEINYAVGGGLQVMVKHRVGDFYIGLDLKPLYNAAAAAVERFIDQHGLPPKQRNLTQKKKRGRK